jgi:hypothetical protein
MLVVVVFTMLGACTGHATSTSFPPPTSTSAGAAGSRALCHQRIPPPPAIPGSATTSPVIERIATQVAAIRGRRLDTPVAGRRVSATEMAKLVRQEDERSMTRDLVIPAQRTFEAMGAIPPGTDLEAAVEALESSVVAGFYDPDTKLVAFIGASTLTPFDELTLAHELTHAVDDRTFGLAPLERLSAECLDDQATAFQALAEGDAEVTSFQWAGRNLSPSDRARLQHEAAAASAEAKVASSVPPFVRSELEFPYPAGIAFVEALLERGGEGAVDDAFGHPPVSTEQVLHPDRYPSDVPTIVRPPDLAARLGPRWSLLETDEAGEGFLRDVLSVRLGGRRAAVAAAGWDGGVLRSWSAGTSVAVDMVTVWDSMSEARDFAAAVRTWIGARPAQVVQRGAGVTVLFGSSPTALASIRAAATG